MKSMSDKIQELKELQNQLVGEVIKVTVVMLNVKEWTVKKDETKSSGQRENIKDFTIAWTETIFVKPNNKMQTLFNRVEERRPCPTGRSYIFAEKYWDTKRKSYKFPRVKKESTWVVSRFAEGKSMHLYAYYAYQP